MSVDAFLGLPFNIASYALLQHIFATLLKLEPRYLVGDLTNVHIYRNHINQVLEQLSREHKTLPSLGLPAFNTLEELLDKEVEDFTLINYDCHPTIKAAMAV